MKVSCKKLILLMLICCLSPSLYARNHQIFTVAEDLPMGFDDEVLKKNYYVDIGSQQGVRKGTTLDVYRVISKANPYNDQKRVNYKVKIGELEVLHAEDGSAIGTLKKFEGGLKSPLFEVSGFMIGDHVTVKVK